MKVAYSSRTKHCSKEMENQKALKIVSGIFQNLLSIQECMHIK